MSAVLAATLSVVPVATASVPAVSQRGGSDCTLVGTPRDDVLRGTRGDDVICGLGGDDRIVGRAGDDVLRGGPGDDLLVGRAGDDVLAGGRGRDELRASDRDDYSDRLSCGRDRDRAVADPGDVVLASCEDVQQDHAPTDIALTPATVAENQPAGTTVGHLTATDPDLGDGHEFSLVPGGADTDSFRLDGATLVTTRSLDHETTPTLTITVRATDGAGLSIDRPVTVTVTDTDDPPLAIDDQATVQENSDAIAIDVLANDGDVDGGPRSVASVTQPVHGTVTIVGSGGAVAYRPEPGYCGSGAVADSFTYTLAPGGSTGTVRVAVTCVEIVQGMQDDRATVAEDSGPTAIPVLANDVGGHGASIASVTQPAGGTVVITGGGAGLTYAPHPDMCTGAGTPDTFTYTVGSASASVAVTVTCVPDSPVLETSDGTTAYAEGDPATPVDPALELTDADAAGLITGATVEIGSGLAAAQDVLSLTGAHPGITASYDAGTLTLDGDASASAYRAALRDVAYRNTSDAPSTSGRTVTFEVTDDTGLSDAATKTLDVSAVNDPPQLAPADADLDYTEDGAAVAVADDLTVTDLDDTAIVSATVRIAADRQVGDDLGFVDTDAVTGSYDGATGTLHLLPVGASATIADFQAALRAVTFSTANDEPTATRTIEITVDDGDDESTPATRTIEITPTDDAPRIADSAGTVTVDEDDPLGEAVDADLTLEDPDDTHLVGATIAVTAGLEDGDTLVFTDQSGIVGGSYDAAAGTLELTGSATVAAYRDALRSVRFLVDGQDPSASTRTVTFTVDDGDMTTTSAGRSVDVRPSNDPPVNTVPGDQAVAEDGTLVFGADNAISVSDVDAGGDDLRVTLTVTHGTVTLGGTSGLVFETGDGTADPTVTFTGSSAAANAALSGAAYSPTGGYAGTASLTITTDDLGHHGGAAASDTDTVAIVVRHSNRPPVNQVPPAQSVNEDASLVFSSANGNQIGVADADAGDQDVDTRITVTHGTLTLGGSTGLTFLDQTADGTDDIHVQGTISDIDAALAGLTYTPSADFAGSAQLTITTHDQGNTGTGGDLSDSDSVDITVRAVNDAPRVSGPVSVSVTEGGTGSVGVAVSDVDAGAGDLEVSLAVGHGTLTLGTTSGLTFTTGDGTADTTIVVQGTLAKLNAALATLSYRGAPDFDGADQLDVWADDLGNTGPGGRRTASRSVGITVAGVNDAPVLTVPSSVSVDEDTSGPVAGVEVSDVDAGPGDLEVSLTVAHGTLTLGTTTGLMLTAGDGTEDAHVVAQGTLPKLNAALATLSYRGDADFAGADQLDVTIDDLGNSGTGGRLTDSDSMGITVAPVNDAPSFVTGSDLADVANSDDADQPSPQSFPGWATDISAGPGEGGQTLTFETTNDANALFDVQPAVAADGTLTFTPDPGQAGTATVSVRLHDDGGTARGGADASAIQTFTITTVDEFRSGPTITGISPARLAPGTSATITGHDFSTTLGENVVTIGGADAPVTSGTDTTLNVTVPCVSSGAGVAVKATVNGVDTNTVNHPLDVPQHSLDVGQAAFVTDPSQVGCSEIASADGPAKYLVAVYNSNTGPTSSTSVKLSGDPTGDAPAPRPVRRATDALTGPGADAPSLVGVPGGGFSPPSEAEDPELELTERNRQAYRVLRKEFGTKGVQRRRTREYRTAADLPLNRTIRIPNVNASNFCNSYYEVNATRVYAGGKLVIYEDDDTPTALKAANNPAMASYYQQIGDQFNADMEPIIRTNFGDILRRDAELDNNGVLIALSTPRLNQSFSGFAGFVVSCDQFPNDDSSAATVGGPQTGTGVNGSSNFGEYFYMYQPTSVQSGYSGGTADNWYRTIRSTFIHESKHIASYAARVANDAPTYEASWLEEGTARLVEELWGRQVIYQVPWKGNTGYGSAANPVGPYCDARPGFAECAGPRAPVAAIQRHFASLYTTLNVTNARLLSPFGATPSDNGSYWYANAWSLIRYALDRYGASEPDFLNALTQSTTSGATNLAARAGVPIDRLLGGWALALRADDYPGLTGASPDIQMQNWNYRDIFAGLNRDFPSTYMEANPGQPSTSLGNSFPFGSFTGPTVSTMYGGGVLWYELSGDQTAPQLLRLTAANGATLSSSTPLRIAVARLQ